MKQITSEALKEIKHLLITTDLTHAQISQATGISSQRISMFAVAWELQRPRGRRPKWKPRELIEAAN